MKDNACVRFVSSVKNLGVKLDSSLSMTTQVNKSRKSSCCHTIRKIAKMKRFLSTDQLKTLMQDEVKVLNNENFTKEGQGSERHHTGTQPAHQEDHRNFSLS